MGRSHRDAVQGMGSKDFWGYVPLERCGPRTNSLLQKLIPPRDPRSRFPDYLLATRERHPRLLGEPTKSLPLHPPRTMANLGPILPRLTKSSKPPALSPLPGSLRRSRPFHPKQQCAHSSLTIQLPQIISLPAAVPKV